MAEAKSQTQALQSVSLDGSDLASLLQKEFKPKTDQAREAVEQAVLTLAQQALAQTQLISDNLDDSIKAIIAELDRKLSDQVNEILHHEDFQKLESSWRGLHYLVNNTQTDEMLQIRVMNISKNELGRTLAKFRGASWDVSPIFKRVYEEEFGQWGGKPYGAIVGDYYFDHSPQDMALLGEMSKVCAASHTVFISGTAPTLLQMESWQELANPKDLKSLMRVAEYAPWRSLRATEDSRYIGLAMPRFLARLPYNPKTNPADGFNFEEDTTGADHSKYSWANSAYAMAVNVNRSFKDYGWCSNIRGIQSGGIVEGLPVHTFPTDDGGQDMKCPTEIAISDRRDAELADIGLLPLSHRKNEDHAAFITAQSLHLPDKYEDDDATANAQLGARLPYIFACNRFAHYLKCIARDNIGRFKEREDVSRWLNNWIMQYVDGDPANSSERTKAEKPLAGAEIVVEDVPGKPGYYTSKFYLRPHYQLEGLTVALRLVSKLPSQKQA